MKHYFYRDGKRTVIRELLMNGWSNAGLAAFRRQCDENPEGIAAYRRIEVKDGSAEEHEYLCLRPTTYEGEIPTPRTVSRDSIERILHRYETRKNH